MSIPSVLSLPGRLGNAELKLYKDPRAHPKLITGLKSIGSDGSTQNPADGLPFEVLSSPEFMANSEAAIMQVYGSIPIDLPLDKYMPRIEESTHHFSGLDGAQRKMYAFRLSDLRPDAPAVVYLHGGGMTIGQTWSRLHVRWCQTLAARGVLVVAVDFRNAWTEAGHNPFPTGLDDCVAAVRHLHARKDELGFGKLILQGESGGANLAMATSLRAKKEGWIDQIDGLFVFVPLISNGYRWPLERKLGELPSLVENDGFFLSCDILSGMGHYYAPEDEQNPLAWPYHASVDDCRGLPPHRIIVDELDPLRDEGMAYYRKLSSAGVSVTARVNLGLTHAASLIFRQLLSEHYMEAIDEIVGFAKST